MTDEQLIDANPGDNNDVPPISELPEPPEERLAQRIVERPGQRTPRRQKLVALLRQVGHADRVAYRAVAGVSAPLLDTPLRRLSNAANWSRSKL